MDALTLDQIADRHRRRFNSALREFCERANEYAEKAFADVNEIAEAAIEIHAANDRLALKAKSAAMTAAAALEGDLPAWELNDLMRDLSWALDQLGSRGIERDRVLMIADRFGLPAMVAAGPDLPIPEFLRDEVAATALDEDDLDEEEHPQLARAIERIKRALAEEGEDDVPDHVAEAVLHSLRKTGPADFSKCAECRAAVGEDEGPPAHVMEVLDMAVDALGEAGIHADDIGVNLIREGSEFTIELHLPRESGIVSALKTLIGDRS